MKRLYIQQATLINEGERFTGSVLVEGDTIAAVYREGEAPAEGPAGAETVDAAGLWLLPGVIDDQVHFRDPGLTHKGDMATESRAAVAGGVTSFMDMPNTKPQTVTLERLAEKQARAAEVSRANYAFFLGATNDNVEELKRIDPRTVPAVKLFMGASTGNMLVDDPQSLAAVFAESPVLIAAHCEKEEIIRANVERFRAQYGDDLPVRFHPLIRSEEACYASSSQAVELAHRYGSRLHLFHLSTARELALLEERPLEEKRITGEVCVHHLWFSDADYARLGNRIKWNPAVKRESDRQALLRAVAGNRIDVIATDHAPHLPGEKEGNCLTAASGGPLVQYSLVAMLELAAQGWLTPERVVEKMAHAPARLYGVERRGFIRPGFFADLVLVDPAAPTPVTPETILSKCGWSPFEEHIFPASVARTYVNGELAYAAGVVNDSVRGRALTFNGASR